MRFFGFLSGLLPLMAVGLLGCGGDGRTGGSCDPECGSSQACCGSTCVFTLNDPNNCGACGTVCPSGVCVEGACTPTVDSGTSGGACTPACPDTLQCCGTSCVARAVPQNTDGRSDPSFSNCNGCGITCDSERALSCSIPGGGTTGSPRCLCGDFDQCLAGEVCLNNGGVWGCTSLSSDPNNCGAVGNSCAEGEACVAGSCVCGSTGASCPSGQSCCAGACIDTSSDALNCGGCGMSCTPNAPDCQAGSCTCAASGRACTQPVAGLPLIGGEMPGESCCPSVGCVANTADSCGCEACGDGEDCAVGGSGLFGAPGGGGDELATVCCGDPTQISLLGCEGFGGIFGDGGLGFPSDGGFGLPLDAGTSLPFDAGIGGGMDAGMDGGS